MNFRRRQLMRSLSLALGSNLILGRKRLNAAGMEPTPPPHGTEARERVLGFGGFFFRAKDPKALAAWYEQHLGIPLPPTSETDSVWRQEEGPTIFQPFPETTHYFGDVTKSYLLNFRVRDLDKMAAQLQASGIAIKIDPQAYPNGRFARIHDPEGNPIELWQPKTT
jgi:glyoxylase I family protein